MSTRPITPLEGAIAPGNSPGWEIIVAPRRVGARAGTHEERPRVAGKFLFVGGEKLYVRGVTYGAFRPDEMGNEYHDLRQIESDFARMASVGIPHTTPPRALLDAALRHGLRVMVGLSAEQYVGFLIDRKGAPDIAALIRARVRGCAGHPAVLCYALGNEIPASLVRWLGPRRVARYLERLYRIVKEEDPDSLVTYVNYPTTEYLELPFLDLLCFNVYLESHDQLDAYLARLQNLVGDRPLILSEIGLDSLRNGEDLQARSLDDQIRVDRRVVSGRCRRRRLGLWPHAPGPAAEAGARRRAGSVRGGAVPARSSVASHLRRGLHVQRPSHDPRMPRRPRPAGVPGLRSDRRGRRVDGRHGGDRGRVPGPPDPRAAPGAEQRAEHGPRRGDGRHRGVHRR